MVEATSVSPTSGASNGQMPSPTHSKENTPPRWTAVNGRESPTVHVKVNGIVRPVDKGSSPPELGSSPTLSSPASQRSAHIPSTTQSRQLPPLPDINGLPNHRLGTDQIPYPRLNGDSSGSVRSEKRKRSQENEDLTSRSNAAHHTPDDSSLDGPRRSGVESRPQPRSPRAQAIQPAARPSAKIDRSKPPALNNCTSAWYDYNTHEWHFSYDDSSSESPTHRDRAENQLAEVLQLENKKLDSQRGVPEAQYDDGQPKLKLTAAGVQVNHHQKRKRVFSNRTKTGCLTCRRRKKKCDEKKPECNNCLRGGFVCEGYAGQVSWPEPPKKTPIPLQSKEGYPESPVQYVHSRPQIENLTGPNDTYARPTGEYGRMGPGQAVLRTSETPHTRPIAVEDERRPPVTRSPETWAKGPVWKNNGEPSYLSDHLPQTDFTRVPPLNELAHHERQGGRGPDRRPVIEAQQPVYFPTPPGEPYKMQSQAAQAQAQLALQHEASLRALRPASSPEKHSPMDRDERVAMTCEKQYRPNAPQLVDDRDRCKALCWRFNNIMFLSSREERARMFREILNAEGSPIIDRLRPVTRVGERVTVEQPFNCDYGYNISVGNDVTIGAGCRISDSCPVSIGNNCVLSPGVQLIGFSLPIDPDQRRTGEALGARIIIEDDCWIGGGAIIQPGIRIGQGSTIGPGSVVAEDVPRCTVVGGNPAKVIRAIYPSGPSSTVSY